MNESSIKKFKPEKDLRHENSLTTLLFLMVAEGLVCAIGQAENKRMLEEIWVGRDTISVSMLQFVDDIIFVYHLKLENILTIKSILKCFELNYGLKVNLHKSRLGVLGIGQRNIHMFSQVLNCRTWGFHSLT